MYSLSRTAQVIGAADLTKECVQNLASKHHGRPDCVSLDEVEGTFRLVYATREASILAPRKRSACVRALLELLAAALTPCRSWTPAEWRSRHLVRKQSAAEKPPQCVSSEAWHVNQRLASVSSSVVAQQSQPVQGAAPTRSA